ncbi:MAG: sugar phosphate isomerase/epimerase [Spirochaetaceae bacterium]|nr:MAG: sugar phosphate isomerase/epimerase [Spirochaetaceae bacterium]
MFGVSPAYFISRCGDRFTPRNVIEGLADLKALGFDGFQLEIYHADTIQVWTGGGFGEIFAAADTAGMTISQFVGHALLNAFSDEAALLSPWGIAETAAIAALLPPERCPVFTLPIPAFTSAVGLTRTLAGWTRIEQRFVEKLGAMAGTIERRGLQVALEVLPGSLVGGIHGFLTLAERLQRDGVANLGFNLDTGHAWASREPLALAIARLGYRIVGTHLCDNWAAENLSLAPGSAGIDWPAVLSTLRATRYPGSYDIEIHCAADEATAEYAKALRFVSAAMNHTPVEEAV